MILAFAPEDLMNFSQSREGPFEFCEVMISTTSPTCSCVESGTIFELTRAPVQRLPTSEWMA